MVHSTAASKRVYIFALVASSPSHPRGNSIDLIYSLSFICVSCSLLILGPQLAHGTPTTAADWPTRSKGEREREREQLCILLPLVMRSLASRSPRSCGVPSTNSLVFDCFHQQSKGSHADEEFSVCYLSALSESNAHCDAPQCQCIGRAKRPLLCVRH